MSQPRDFPPDMADGSFPPEMVPFDIDNWTADRLLDGRVPPPDAPPGYGSVAQMIRAAQAPATAEELSRESETVAAALAAWRDTPVITRPAALAHASRANFLTRLQPRRAAADIVVGMLGIASAAAAATGSLPILSSSPHQGHVSIAAPLSQTATRANGHARDGGAVAGELTTAAPDSAPAATTPAGANGGKSLTTVLISQNSRSASKLVGQPGAALNLLPHPDNGTVHGQPNSAPAPTLNATPNPAGHVNGRYGQPNAPLNTGGSGNNSGGGSIGGSVGSGGSGSGGSGSVPQSGGSTQGTVASTDTTSSSTSGDGESATSDSSDSSGSSKNKKKSKGSSGDVEVASVSKDTPAKVASGSSDDD